MLLRYIGSGLQALFERAEGKHFEEGLGIGKMHIPKSGIREGGILYAGIRNCKARFNVG